jgi:hypothetical protein
VPTGREMDDIFSGLEGMLRDHSDVGAKTEQYVRSEVAPQFERMAAAIGPIIRAGTERESYEAARASKVAQDLSNSLDSLTHDLSAALVGAGGDPAGIVQRAYDKADSLGVLINTLGWKDPQALEAAQREVGRLQRLLRWDAIESKVIT